MQAESANSMGCPMPRSVAIDRDASTSASRTPELFERVGDISSLLYNALRLAAFRPIFQAWLLSLALFCDISQKSRYTDISNIMHQLTWYINSLIFPTTADKFLTTSSFRKRTILSPNSCKAFSRLASSSYC